MSLTPIKSILIAGLLVTASMPSYAAERLDKTGRDALAPHKAVYDIEMTARRSSSQVLNIHGQMYFALQPSCEAWSTDHRFNLYYEYADSPPMQITSDFTTYEPLDGKSFDFNSRRKRDGELYQELRGTALRDNDGLVHVTYTAPDGLTFEMPKEGLFPMAHTARMMDSIRGGGKVYSAVVFDGSDEEGPIEINTIVGKPMTVSESMKADPAIDQSLLNSPARKVRMAFFPVADDNPAADYEMDIVVHDNGVISDMAVDYGEFSVSQKLVALEKVNAPACSNEAAGPAPKTEPKAEKPLKKLFKLIP